MTPQVNAVLDPFVRLGLFESHEKAVTEMARDYILRQIEEYQVVTETLQTKYGMNYEQFNAYLQARAAALVSSPDPRLNQAIMLEEEDALSWKIAQQMLTRLLGLRTEAGV